MGLPEETEVAAAGGGTVFGTLGVIAVENPGTGIMLGMGDNL
jgi:hypothetical protein